MSDQALELAILFHVIYERKAAEFNYVTRTETRIFDPDSSNGKLMVAVCEEILQDYVPRKLLELATSILEQASMEVDGGSKIWWRIKGFFEELQP